MKKIIVLILIFIASQNVFAQWILQNEPKTYGVQFATFLNQSTGYVQPAIDTVLYKTTNGGVNWIKTTSRYQNNRTQIINDSTLVRLSYIISSLSHVLVKTTNSGITWQIIYTAPSTFAFGDVCFVNELTGWIGGRVNTQYADTAVLWRTTNGGQTFEQQLTHYNGHSFSYLFFTKDTLNGKYWGFALLGNGYGKITTNSGETWSEYKYFAATYPTMKIKFWNRNIGFICNYHSANLFKTTNGGLNWITLNLPSNLYGRYNVIDFKVINPEGAIYCVGGEQNSSGGFVWKSTNGGANWRVQNLDSVSHPHYAWALDFINPDTGWVFCNGGTTFKTTNGGGQSYILGVEQTSSIIPDKYSLSQNYPNPFNPSTHINYELRNTNYVTLKVFDLLGKEVATLVNEKQNAGSYAVDFNSAEFNLPSGIYFYTLNAGEFKETKKMVLVK